jgi:hypothetical protein
VARFSHYEPCPKCREAGKDSRGDNLVVFRDGGYHCFSCGNHRNASTSKVFDPTPVEEDHGTKSLLPFDFTREVPTAAWKWLLQYGLGYKYWQAHCGYSPYYRRLVFKVGQPTQFSIGRLIEEDTASISGTSRNGVRLGILGAVRPVDTSEESLSKALNRPQEARSGGNQYPGSQNHANRRKWYVWGDSHKHAEVIRGESAGFDGTVVLVEDLISAHKVGQVAESIPLFGTNTYPCHLWHLKNSADKVVLWLDQDQADGLAKKANRISTLVGVPVLPLTTKLDPKSLSFKEIKENLQKVLDL